MYPQHYHYPYRMQRPRTRNTASHPTVLQQRIIQIEKQLDKLIEMVEYNNHMLRSMQQNNIHNTASGGGGGAIIVRM